MPDIIKLLPDSVANQIAAGEVIQRPASAVKELLENAVDAGADDIQVIVKDAGRTLVQVIDNGCGMSVTDARMSFERHATSKITEAKDLFAIRTLGFRGEALASIAAISQLEMKTKRTEDELGSCITIEGSKLIDQSPCTTANGTIISVKNLFFNVPARRNFLKSNAAELRHITEEFLRVALVYPEVSMSLRANNKYLYQLKKSGLKERLVGIYGKQYRERLVPVEQESSIANIRGFVGKPEFARKTRGEQYFFVNGRYIRHPYLHHSVEQAFQELLPSDTHPSYFIYIETDTDKIDINIHPTKTEVNFQDQQHIYAILKSAIRQALGKFNISPAIDFDVEQSIEFSPPDKNTPVRNPFDKEPGAYNPFQSSPPARIPESERERSNRENWEMLFDGRKAIDEGQAIMFTHESGDVQHASMFQFLGKYIITAMKSGIIIIHQRRAHERILYERYMQQLEEGKSGSQQELFPQQITFSLSDAEIIRELRPQLEMLGFSFEELGKNTFVITGIPVDTMNNSGKELLEKILDNYKKNLLDLNQDQRVVLARAMAMNMAMKTPNQLSTEEMENLVSRLFSSSMPDTSPDGKKIIHTMGEEDINKLF
ncbi:MAG: DNA mismatch repair endonuclease MutL [Bacteroidales bacterium]|jgi:DNA mismatch repair protein MutL|nr:DNA mismatch repair endonuclease MutL [Bacteroidales bacterium]